jgi:uncharacterized protein (TIGR02145 family)
MPDPVYFMLLRLNLILFQICKWFSLTVMALFLLPLNIASQSTPQTSSQPQKKIALVIGNGNYSSSILANPENDAKAMRVALQSVGFTVMEYENLSQVQMKKAIDDFGAKLRTNEVGLFFYAGHGIQSKGYNYLIPVDAELKSEAQVEYDCVQADRVLALMEASSSKVNIIILDACRSNPFERSWTRSTTGRGLAFMNAPKGSLIAYATSPGSTASDGSGENGLYTSAILESIKIPNITILEMFQNVRNIVTQKSNNEQTPWESTSLTGNFYLNANGVLLVNDQNNQEEFQKETNTSESINSGFLIDHRDNQRYKIIRIDNQIWMSENLRATKLNNGENIPLVVNPKDWSKLEIPGYCWSNKDTLNRKLYGALYNWYALNSGMLCPTGWHVPNDKEFTTLILFLGGEEITGEKLKEIGSDHWIDGNSKSTNESGFTALPNGYRDIYGRFKNIGQEGIWWRETKEGTNILRVWKLTSRSSKVEKIGSDNDNDKKNGFSVRCIKDN